MQVSDAKKVGVIVVTTDKGLCGGMNTNVLRVVTNKLREQQDAGIATEAVAIGGKGLGFLNRVGAKVVSHATGLGDTPHLDKLIGPVKVLLDQYAEGKLSAVYLAYTKFINTMKQESVVEQLLPCRPKNCKPRRRVHPGNTSTSPTLRASSTNCWFVTWSLSCTRQLRKTWRPSNRRAWWP